LPGARTPARLCGRLHTATRPAPCLQPLDPDVLAEITKDTHRTFPGHQRCDREAAASGPSQTVRCAEAACSPAAPPRLPRPGRRPRGMPRACCPHPTPAPHAPRCAGCQPPPGRLRWSACSARTLRATRRWGTRRA
jgi:hypothetical protein